MFSFKLKPVALAVKTACEEIGAEWRARQENAKEQAQFAAARAAKVVLD